ncbi:MAG: NYN domain-containing protein, partial [Oscillospiraceae bacterium]|nr:NYN domain-containing protein [Oscillospiraceae bacterium]
MKRLTIGILAHVDSGKTTLTEGLLYAAGAIRRPGRVDHGDAFLDTEALEKERGITIFSKQARLLLSDTELTLLDTPGHVDFSAEMERTLSVLDYAILVVSGSEGVQSHTETLWKLLLHTGVPVLIFVNKMDISHFSREELMYQLRERFSPSCVDFTVRDDSFAETVGSCDETLMELVLEGEMPGSEALANAVRARHIFPCVFGSALKFEGTDEFLSLLQELTLPLPERAEFGAKVFKLTEDEQGRRLTHMKITGGVLCVKDVLSGEEKVNQIRLYSSAKYTTADEVYPGTVCAVTGLSAAYPGQGLGTEADAQPPVLEPVLRYAVRLPQEISVHTALTALRRLEEEDPQLHVQFSGQLQEIHVLLMGEIQLAVLQHVLAERFSIQAEFVPGGVAYKETIANRVEGMGHYEPLRHYAEVRLLLEPGELGSGLVFSSVCREDALDRNWQRLILSHLREKTHLGVLTGAPITDMKITLTAGRAHKKHTEGGDFRQATWRAVRQGLMQAESVLLEPWYQIRLEVPSGSVGRAMTDLQMKGAKLSAPQTLGEYTVIEGSAPAAVMMTYRTELMEYTRGKGRLSCTSAGYAPCANAEEIIAAVNYQPEADLDNSPDSVFCSHGAGVLVKWDEVENRMHTESYLHPAQEIVTPVSRPVRQAYTGSAAQDKELMEIFERTYGSIKRDKRDERHHLHTEKVTPKVPKATSIPVRKGPEYLLVDGYNIIFAWDELKKIAAENLDAARARLVHILSNFRGYRQCHLIVVFDAYRVKGNPGTVTEESGIIIVYTKESVTADTYIERISHQLAKVYR